MTPKIQLDVTVIGDKSNDFSNLAIKGRHHQRSIGFKDTAGSNTIGAGRNPSDFGLYNPSTSEAGIIFAHIPINYGCKSFLTAPTQNTYS